MHVWTNATETGKSFALWFVGIEPKGSWLWVIAGVAGKGLGLDGVEIRQVADLADVRREMDEDDLGSPPWVAIEPERAVAMVHREFERARTASWARQYPDHYKKVESEYEKFRDVLGGPGWKAGSR